MGTFLIERTAVEFPTHGPKGEGGESWHEYFVRLRLEREEKLKEEPTKEPIVVVSAREASPEEVASSRSLVGFQKLASENGWFTKFGYSKTFLEGGTIKTGDNAGELHDDITTERMWLSGHRTGNGIIIIIFVRRNDGKWVCDLRMANRTYHNMSDKEVKEWITSDILTNN